MFCSLWATSNGFFYKESKGSKLIQNYTQKWFQENGGFISQYVLISPSPLFSAVHPRPASTPQAGGSGF